MLIRLYSKPTIYDVLPQSIMLGKLRASGNKDKMPETHVKIKSCEELLIPQMQFSWQIFLICTECGWCVVYKILEVSTNWKTVNKEIFMIIKFYNNVLWWSLYMAMGYNKNV